MRLDQLRLFLRAVEEGSISAAARKSHLAQPAFSAHIRALEESLGARLFERSTKGVTLTPAGERLHDGARSLLRHVEQVRAETVSEGRDIAGEVRLVLAASMAPLLAGQLYWGVREAHPGIKLVIRDLLRVESETLVTSRQVDFGLLPNVATWVGAASEPVIAQELYLVGRELPPGVGPDVPFSQLAKFPLVVGGRRNQLRIDLENTAAREGYRINVAIEQDSLSVFRSIVMAGPVYTVVPYSAFSVEIEAGLLQAARIVEPRIERSLFFVWHEFSALSVPARATMDLLRSQIERLIQRGALRGHLL